MADSPDDELRNEMAEWSKLGAQAFWDFEASLDADHSSRRVPSPISPPPTCKAPLPVGPTHTAPDFATFTAEDVRGLRTMAADLRVDARVSPQPNGYGAKAAFLESLAERLAVFRLTTEPRALGHAASDGATHAPRCGCNACYSAQVVRRDQP